MAVQAREILRSVVIQRVDASRREAFGVIGAPLQQFSPGQIVSVADYKAARAAGRIHYDGGCWTEDDLREMAHRFLAQAGAAAFDQQHDRVAGVAVAIESWVPDVDDAKWGYPAGSWVVGCKILDDGVWEKVQDGSYRGFSVRMLAVDDEVEIVLDDEASTHIKLTYFRDPTPVLVSIVDKPATGVPFEIVRFVTDPAAALPDVGDAPAAIESIASPEPTPAAAPAEEPPAPVAAPAVADQAPAPADPIPVMEDRSMSTDKKPGILDRVAKYFDRRAADDPEAKAIAAELSGVHEVDRAVQDFDKYWNEGAASSDTWRAFDILQWCVWDAHWAVYDKTMTSADAKAQLGASIDQFKAVVLSAVDKVVVDRAEGAAKAPALSSPAAALKDHVRFVTEKAIDRAGKKLSTSNRAKVDEAMAAAQAACDALQALIDATEDETVTDNACKDTNRSEPTPAVAAAPAAAAAAVPNPEVEKLRAELAAANAAIETLQAETTPPAPAAPVVAEPDPEVVKLRSELAAKQAEVERLRSMRPAAQADSADRPVETDRSEKVEPKKVFERSQFFSKCLVRGGGATQIADSVAEHDMDDDEG